MVSGGTGPQKRLEMTSQLESAKRQFISKHVLSENVRPSRSPLPVSNAKQFQHPLSVFARNRVHQLSDIREVSASSRAGTIQRKPASFVDGPDEAGIAAKPQEPNDGRRESASDHNPITVDARTPGGLASRATSVVSLPVKDVPERRSSASVLGHNATSRQSSMQDFPSWGLPAPPSTGLLVTIPSRGRSDSPVRKALQRDAVSSERLRQSPSKTYIRPAPPVDFLDVGTSRHGRIDMSVQLPAPLFVGGGTIEGNITITIDGGPLQKSKAKPIFISKLTIDVIGVEEVHDGRRWIFLSLTTDIFNESHPPPMTLVNSQIPASHSELCWALKPAHASIPFCVNLPLKIGPPTYTSRQAGIRYFVCPTLAVRTGGKQSLIRKMCNVQILNVWDPEKALASLPKPLVASDSISIQSGTQIQRVELTAGLHRQIWVNGSMIFVDIHIANKSSKTVKKIEIQLVKTTLWYSHLAAVTGGKLANHLRLPKRTDKELVSTSTLKKSKDWRGVPPNCSDIRTCDISIPRGLVTISTGRFFEVRYFLNVIVTVSTFKTIAVQLPVTVIHMNSLDILPNSLAQVAASIEAKRAKTVPLGDVDSLSLPFHQGQAFTAPRRQSLHRTNDEDGGLNAEELSALRRDLDDSPRRYGRGMGHGHDGKETLGSVFQGDETLPVRPKEAPSSHHHHKRHPDCYHCHLQHDQLTTRNGSISTSVGPKLPRLQLSTSGLGFSDTEFEIAPDPPPRKVMLSESERQIILQHREQKLQRQQSGKNRRKPSLNHSIADKESVPGSQSGYWGWKNVAVELEDRLPRPNRNDGGQAGVQRAQSTRIERAAKRRSGPTRMRSKTNPDRLGPRPFPPRRLEGSFKRANQSQVSTRPSFDGTGHGPHETTGGNDKSSMPTNEASQKQ